jgi:hypothetical protein
MAADTRATGSRRRRRRNSPGLSDSATNGHQQQQLSEDAHHHSNSRRHLARHPRMTCNKSSKAKTVGAQSATAPNQTLFFPCLILSEAAINRSIERSAGGYNTQRSAGWMEKNNDRIDSPLGIEELLAVHSGRRTCDGTNRQERMIARWEILTTNLYFLFPPPYLSCFSCLPYSPLLRSRQLYILYFPYSWASPYS